MDESKQLNLPDDIEADAPQVKEARLLSRVDADADVDADDVAVAVAADVAVADVAKADDADVDVDTDVDADGAATRRAWRLPQGDELRFRRPSWLRALGWRRRPLLWLSLLLVLLILLGLWRWSYLAQLLSDQQLAARWRGESETPFAQATAYFESGAGLSEQDIYEFRQKADQALLDAGLEAPEGGALYIDAWCGLGELSLSTPQSVGQVKATALGVGGDWFSFHPLPLRDGVYLGADDLMHDRVLLSEALAFSLFGAMDVAGMELLIDDQPYLVAGVVRLPQDEFTAALKLNQSWVFVYADQLPQLSFSSYELVMADPLDNFVVSQLSEQFPAAQVKQNSNRFHPQQIWQLTSHFAQSRVSDKGIAYPWWENAARMVEARLALLLPLLLAAALLPLIYAGYWLLRLLIHSYRQAKSRLKAWRER